MVASTSTFSFKTLKTLTNAYSSCNIEKVEVFDLKKNIKMSNLQVVKRLFSVKAFIALTII